MVVDKKVIFVAGLDTHRLWLSIVALQKFLQITKRKDEQERTFYTTKLTEKIFIRERLKSIYIKYLKLRTVPKYISKKAIIIGNERGKEGISKI